MNLKAKEAFLKPLYEDSDDEAFNKYPTKRKKTTKGIASSQGVPSSQVASSIIPSSRDISSATSLDDVGFDKHSYCVSVDQVNKEWRLDKKKLLKPRSKKLEGLVLFYWPAWKGTAPVKHRQGAIGAVLEHGAIVAKHFDDVRCITHIVVDNPSMRYLDVIKDLKLQEIPENIQLVKSSWITEKIRFRTGDLIKPYEKDHRMTGHPKPSGTSPPAKEKTKRSASDAQLHARPEIGKHTETDAPPLKRYATEADVPPSKKHATAGNVRGGAFHRQTPFDVQAITLANARENGLNIDIKDPEVLKRVEAEERKRKARIDGCLAIAAYEANSDVTTVRSHGDALDELAAELEEDASILDAPSEEEEDSKDDTQSRKARGFLCSKSNIKGAGRTGPNAELITLLDELADHYEKRKDDMFRAKGYRMAVSVIKKQKTQISTLKEAKQLPRVGDSIARKIAEFIETGKIGKLQEFRDDPKERAIDLFSGIYGVGTTTASSWATQGYRTLADISKLPLQKNQRIGLERYNDFNSRIPRSEVDAHVSFVTAAALQISPHLEVVVGGSYRRGQPDCGDIDFLITAPDSEISTPQLEMLVYEHLIKQLREIGYIKADLTLPSETKKNTKWLGAASLPDLSPQIWRRIDILVVPNAEWGAALIYFTGNDIFNRSLRLLARRSGGSLNQRGLYKNVVRDAKGIKTQNGVLVEGRDEKKIFDALGVKWRPPHERCP